MSQKEDSIQSIWIMTKVWIWSVLIRINKINLKNTYLLADFTDLTSWYRTAWMQCLGSSTTDRCASAPHPHPSPPPGRPRSIRPSSPVWWPGSTGVSLRSQAMNLFLEKKNQSVKEQTDCARLESLPIWLTDDNRYYARIKIWISSLVSLIN